MKNVLVAICVCCIALPLAAQEKLTLRYGLQKGKVYLYEEVTNATNTQEMMGQEMKSTQMSRSVLRTLVDDVRPDGSLSLVNSPDSMVVSVKSTRMDTTIARNDLIGKRKTVLITPTGVVLRRGFIDTVQQTPLARMMPVRDMGRYHQFSAAPVAVGDKWTSVMNDTTEMMGGSFVTVANMEYTVAGKEAKLGHNCVKLTYKGTTATTGKGTMNGMEIFVEGTGKLAGTLYWDPKGYTVVDETTLDSESTAAITGQQNMTIPSSSTSKTIRSLRSM